jgi:hypothetical protein
MDFFTAAQDMPCPTLKLPGNASRKTGFLKGLHLTVEETEASFSLPEDGLEFRDRFVRACEEATIPTALSPDEALALEPELNPGLVSREGSDGAIDPFS